MFGCSKPLLCTPYDFTEYDYNYHYATNVIGDILVCLLLIFLEVTCLWMPQINLSFCSESIIIFGGCTRRVFYERRIRINFISSESVKQIIGFSTDFFSFEEYYKCCLIKISQLFKVRLILLPSTNIFWIIWKYFIFCRLRGGVSPLLIRLLLARWLSRRTRSIRPVIYLMAQQTGILS